jgi:hypothetical protein
MARNIRYGQPSNYAASADSQVVDVSTFTPFAGGGVDRPDDFSGSDFYIAITDATPNSFTLKPVLRVNNWELRIVPMHMLAPFLGAAKYHAGPTGH